MIGLVNLYHPTMKNILFAVQNLTGLCKVALTQIQTFKNKIHKNQRKIIQKLVVLVM